MTDEMITKFSTPKAAYDAFVGKTLKDLQNAYGVNHSEDVYRLNPFLRSGKLGEMQNPVSVLASEIDAKILLLDGVGPKTLALLNVALTELFEIDLPPESL